VIKGGNPLIAVGVRADVDHDCFNKDMFFLKKLDIGFTEMSKSLDRWGRTDIYKKDIPPENTNNLDVAAKHIEIRKRNVKSFIEMKKQNKRDLTNIAKTTEAFKNVQRDNARADYIKSLLSCDD
jgi:hypothetical protein